MPNPGAFRGSRKEFLTGEKEAYSQAVDGNYTAEALALIFRRYFKRFPVDLPHSTEPSPEHLAAVDDDAPDPEAPEPDIFSLPREEYDAAMKELTARKETIQFRKSQIKRWMAYQYMKDHHVNPKETGARNPFWLLICKLSGKSPERPRKKTAVNLWRKTERAQIEAKIKKFHSKVPRSQLAALRDKIAREMFAKLPSSTREHWELLAESEHRVVIEQWEDDMNAGFSRDPADRQRAIQALVGLLSPILDIICDATGWKATFIAGGPEPAQGGLLNVISIHSGTTPGDVKMTFGHAERANIKKFLIPMFGAFLQKCYTPVECRSRALPSKEAHLSLTELELESQAVTIHTVGQKTESTLPSTSTQSQSTTSSTKSSSIPPAPKAASKTSTITAGASKATRAASQGPIVSKGRVTPNSDNAMPTTSLADSTQSPKSPKSGSIALPHNIVEQTISVADTTEPHIDTQAEGPLSVKDSVADVLSSEGPVDGVVVNPSDARLACSIEGDSRGVGQAAEHDHVLEMEANTLARITAPQEDEVDMTASRSVSPTPSHISPAVSRCPSPIRSPTPVASPLRDTIEDIPAAKAASPTLLSDPSSTTSTSSASNTKKRVLKPRPFMTLSTLPEPLAERPKRTITKTNKLILMEEASSRRGKKRGVDENDHSTVSQAPVKRRRGGKHV